MAKNSKNAKKTSLDPVKIKIGFLVVLTIILFASIFALVQKNIGSSTIGESTRIEGTE